MSCVPRNGIKETVKMNNPMFDMHEITFKPPKGRIRKGMRIVQRSRHNNDPIFMPEWCVYASHGIYNRFTQCTQITHDTMYALGGGSEHSFTRPTRYTQCVFQRMNGILYTCLNVKGGVYKGYTTAKIVKDCMTKIMINEEDETGMNGVILMTNYARSLNHTLEYYNLSGTSWKAGTNNE